MSDNDDNAMEMALTAIQDGPLYIAYELRRMANAEDPYTRFTYTSPGIKNIWRAAAEILEDMVQ